MAETFSFDIDAKHVGVFSTVGGRMNVLPAATTRSFVTIFRHVIGNRLYLGTMFADYETELVGFSVPLLGEEDRFRVRHLVLDLRQDGRFMYFAHTDNGRGADIIEINPAAHSGRALGRIPGQMLRHPLRIEEGLAFISILASSDLWLRRPNGAFAKLTKSGLIRDAERCGPDLVVTREIEPEKTIIERIDTAGRHIEKLSDGPADWSPACTGDGKVWYYRPHLPQASIKRCDRDGCREILRGFAFGLSMSPDSQRLAFVTVETRGSTVQWMPAEGGEPHEVADTETSCPPGWASASTIWVSRRRGRKIVWTEVDADSGRETGRTAPGSHDCNDLRPNPISPVNPDLRVIYDQTSQVRLLPSKHLAAP